MNVCVKIVVIGCYVYEFGDFFSVSVFVMKKVMEQVGWFVDDVDLFEVNEVFVVVVMIVMKELNIFYDKINVNGGVCVLGYFIGVFGVWIVVMLLVVLKNCGLKCGVVGICFGGGEVIVMVVEFIND